MLLINNLCVCWLAKYSNFRQYFSSSKFIFNTILKNLTVNHYSQQKKSMKSLYVILIILIVIMSFACSYDKAENEDSIPPSKVEMTPHKCDPGDPGCAYTDRNNGIDAYSAGSLDYNWMKIQWDDTPLQKDGDIHHIEIWRYYIYIDTNFTFVEEIPFIPDSSTYYDKFIGFEEPNIQKTWSYFIIPFDEAGNSTNSDTVSYRLIEVPGLQAPADNSTFSVNDSIDFSWIGQGGYTYRILFFDTSHNLVYPKDLIPGETSFNISEIDFVPIPGFSYIWRIDAFFMIGQAVGSESEERLINFTR